MKTFLFGCFLFIISLILCATLALSQEQTARMNIGIIGGGVSAAGGITRTDNFNRANEDPLAGNWSKATGSGDRWVLTGNYAQSYGEGTHLWYWNANVFNANQYSQFKIVTNSTFYTGPAVRIQTNGASYDTYILIWKNDTTYNVRRLNASVTTVLLDDTASDDITGKVVKLEVSGTGATVTLKVYVNGEQLGADISDAAVDRITGAGSAGMISYGSEVYVDDWEGGDL